MRRIAPYRRELARFARHLPAVALVALVCWSAGTPRSQIVEHAAIEVRVAALAHLLRVRAALARDRRDG